MGLFQSPSFSTASRVFPRFQPGFIFSTKADAETGVKVPVHFTPPPDVADAVETVDNVVDEDVTVATELDGEDVTVATELVDLEEEDALEVVPGTHW